MKIIQIPEDNYSDAMCYAHKIKKCAEKIGEVLACAFGEDYEDDEDNGYSPVERSHHSRRRHSYRMGGEYETPYDEEMPEHSGRDSRSRMNRGRYSY